MDFLPRFQLERSDRDIPFTSKRPTKNTVGLLSAEINVCQTIDSLLYLIWLVQQSCLVPPTQLETENKDIGRDTNVPPTPSFSFLRAMVHQEYTFKPSHELPNVWTRKCFGFESLVSCMTETLDGFPHLTATACIKPEFDTGNIASYLRESWLALRFAVPAIACKGHRLPAPDNHFTFSYDTSSVENWAKDTLFVTDDTKALYEKHCELRDTTWWKSSADHYIAELHASPVPSGWQISVIFSHNSSDGRNAFALLEQLLIKFSVVVNQQAKPASELAWGEETSRLPPASSMLLHIHEYPLDDTSAEIATSNDIEGKETAKAEPPTVIPWLWAPTETGEKGDISALVTLPQTTTAKLHAACKKHGKTITQAITAFSILAHAEMSLRTAAKSGPDRFKPIAESYATSTSFLIAWNFVNHRHKLPGGHTTFAGERPSPMATVDGIALMIPMDPIRKFFDVDSVTSSVATKTSEESFWTGLVDATANCWKEQDTSLKGYWGRDKVLNDSIHGFQPSSFHIPALIVSSIGDLGRLDIMSAFRPSAKNPTFTVTDVICGVRIRTPPLMNILWQYDDRLSCHLFTAGEYTKKENIDLAAECFKEWIERFI